MRYSDLLRHPQWQKKRLEIMQRDQWQCTGCHADDKMLNVHHRRYIKSRKPWEYSQEDLITLCDECHKTHHDISDFYKGLDWSGKVGFVEKILGKESIKHKAGPFLIAQNPRKSGCLIFHIPSSCWHTFTLSPDQAVQLLESHPESKNELLQIILEGKSAYSGEENS